MKNKIDNIIFDGIDKRDYPDYSDLFIVNADLDGRPMTERELDYLNNQHDLIYELFMNH
jgi:hypothetical protein